MTDTTPPAVGDRFVYLRDTTGRAWTLHSIQETQDGPLYLLGAPSRPGYNVWSYANAVQMREDYRPWEDEPC